MGGWDGMSDTSTGSTAKRGRGAAPAELARPVSKLLLKRPILSDREDMSVLEASQMLANRKGDALLLQDGQGALIGILTDTDILKKVVAKSLDPADILVQSVMTAQVQTVSVQDDSLDALTAMVRGRFRHLPILENGKVKGLLDIGQCLSEAIQRLERKMERQQGPSGGRGRGRQQLGDALMAMMEEDDGMRQAALRRVEELLPTNVAPVNVVRDVDNMLEAATRMAKSRKAAMVVEHGYLVGLVTARDVLEQVVAKERAAMLTSVGNVMTHDPQTIPPEATLLDALLLMRNQSNFNLPVVTHAGITIGLVDVMDIVCSVFQTERGARRFWASAVDTLGDDCSDRSIRSGFSLVRTATRDDDDKLTALAEDEPLDSASAFSAIHRQPPPSFSNLAATPSVLSSRKVGSSVLSASQSEHTAKSGPYDLPEGHAKLKVKTKEGHLKTVTVAATSFAQLLQGLAEAGNFAVDAELVVTYKDKDDDDITVDSDDGVRHMLDYAAAQAPTLLKVALAHKHYKSRLDAMPIPVLVGGALGLLALGLITTMTLRQRK